MSRKEIPSKPTLIHPTAGVRGMTELHYVAYCNDYDAVLSQLKNGAPIDARDDNGWTPLHWSIDMSQACGEPERVVQLLLSHGASANAIDNSGISVLMLACGRNNEQILDAIIAAGANTFLRTVDSTPLHEAAGCNFHEGIRKLLSLGADPNEINSRGETPKDVAKSNGFIKSFRVLRATRPRIKPE
jgi:ankyrin repeat protein